MANKADIELELANLKLEHVELRASHGERGKELERLKNVEASRDSHEKVAKEYRDFAVSVFNLCGGADDEDGTPWGTDIIPKAFARLGRLLRSEPAKAPNA